MSNIIDFFIRYKNTLLFLVLLLFSLVLTLQAHSYQKSKFISSANVVTGGVYNISNNIEKYFGLKETNQRLIDENKDLRQRLLNFYIKTDDFIFPDTTGFAADYSVFNANVISNQYINLDNYILIDRGAKDNIREDQGVITSKGIVGVIEKATPNYARVISILNSQLSINAQLKNSDHFGTLTWKGGDPNNVEFYDVPSLAEVHKGDTIITNGRSFIFPKGIPIGTVQDYKLDQGEDFYIIDVKLFNDMTNIGNVYIIENNDKPEIEKLNTSDDE